MKRTILIIIGILAFIALAVVAVLIAIDQSRKNVTIDIQSVIPDDIIVTVDGARVNSTGKVRVEPGKHTVHAQRNGFGSQTHNFDLPPKETVTLRLILVATNAEGQQWVTDHPLQSLEAEAAAGQEFDQESKAVAEKYPIIPSLPMLRRDWRIDYGASQKQPANSGALALYITYAEESSKQAALDWMRSQDFNPDDYEIIFKKL